MNSMISRPPGVNRRVRLNPASERLATCLAVGGNCSMMAVASRSQRPALDATPAKVDVSTNRTTSAWMPDLRSLGAAPDPSAGANSRPPVRPPAGLASRFRVLSVPKTWENWFLTAVVLSVSKRGGRPEDATAFARHVTRSSGAGGRGCGVSGELLRGLRVSINDRKSGGLARTTGCPG